MGIEIDIPEIEDFEAKIVAEVARQLLYTHSMGDGEREEGYTYSSKLGEQIRKEMVEAVQEQARDAAPIVAAEILEQGVYRVDTYGDRTGNKVSLKVLVAEEIQKSMTGYSHNRKDELGKLAKATIHEEVKAQMVEALDAIVQPVLVELKASASAVFVQALEKALPNLTFPALVESVTTAPVADEDVPF